MKYIRRLNEMIKDNKDVIKDTIDDILLELRDVGFCCRMTQMVKWVEELKEMNLDIRSCILNIKDEFPDYIIFISHKDISITDFYMFISINLC